MWAWLEAPLGVGGEVEEAGGGGGGEDTEGDQFGEGFGAEGEVAGFFDAGEGDGEAGVKPGADFAGEEACDEGDDGGDGAAVDDGLLGLASAAVAGICEAEFVHGEAEGGDGDVEQEA